MPIDPKNTVDADDSDPWQRPGHPSGGDLVAYEDGSADPQRAARIATHLADCATCRSRLGEFREVGRAIRRAFPLPNDPAARARFLADLLGRPDPER